MLPRSFEVLMITLLVLVTALATFTFLNYQVQTQNQQLMRDILTELRIQSKVTSLTSPKPTPATGKVADVSTDAPAPASPPVEVLPVEIQQAKPATPEPESPTPTAKPTTPVPTPPAAVQTEVETESSKDTALWNKHEKQLTDIISQLLTGKYESIVKQFDPHMAANLTLAQLAAVLDPVRKQHGPLGRVVSHNRLTEGLPKTLTAFQILCELADKHRITFTITLDSKNRIAGLFVR